VVKPKKYFAIDGVCRHIQPNQENISPRWQSSQENLPKWFIFFMQE